MTAPTTPGADLESEEEHNFVHLDPYVEPAHILSVRSPA